MAIEIKIDDDIALNISDLQQKIAEYDIPCFKDWILNGWLAHIESRVEHSFHKMETDWKERLVERHEFAPTAMDAKAALIFSQPDYMSRTDREEKIKADREEKIEK